MSIEELHQQQLDAAIRLSRVLDQEAKAIKDRDADALFTLAPQKLESLKQLEALEQARLEHSAIADAATNTAHELPSEPGGQLREKVVRMIEVCQRKNQLNGAMLRLRKDHVQRAMDLIAHRDAATITYAPDGSTKLAAGQFNTSVSA